jgi:uncharacterized protein (TIGR02246 family)
MKRLAISSLALSLVASPVYADDEQDVLAAMNQWSETVAEGCTSDPNKIVALYAPDGVLWGTISATIRSGTDPITDYFVNACQKLPKLSVVFKDPLVRVYGDTAINSGYYTFSYEKDGKKVDLPARYSFTLVKSNGKWLIADHHSSIMPD